MNSTTKLYEINPYTIEFEAAILATEPRDDGRLVVVLDQTAFYPTGGGQPNDLGWIENWPVLDVWKEQGIIYHLLDTSLDNSASELQMKTVIGKIDWARRFDFMQQHAGQHILSRAFEILFQGETVGFHLSDETVTIDVTIPELTEEMVASLEELANQIIMENRPITAELLDVSQVAEHIIEKIPELEDHVRLVSVSDFDQCACAGTHPLAAGEIGLIKIIGWEKYKKNTRVFFVSGKRALRFYSEFQQQLMSASKILKTNWTDVSHKLSVIIKEKEEAEKVAKGLRLELLTYEAEKWKEKAHFDGKVYWIEEVFYDRPFEDLKQLAFDITQSESYLVMLASYSLEKVQFVLQRSNDLEINVNEVIKIGLEMINGKGGGNPKTAQGGGVADENTLKQALSQMKHYMQNQLRTKEKDNEIHF